MMSWNLPRLPSSTYLGDEALLPGVVLLRSSNVESLGKLMAGGMV